MRLVPMATSAAVGVAAAMIRRGDIHATTPRTQLSKQWGTWFEGGVAVGGYLADMMNVRLLPQDLKEPIVYGATSLFAERITRSVQDKGTATSYPGAPYAGARAYAAPYARAAGYTQKTPSLTII